MPIGWSENRKTVSFFAFGNSPIYPSREILQEFQNIQKVHIRLANRDIMWLERLKYMRSPDIYDCNEQPFPKQLEYSECVLETLFSDASPDDSQIADLNMKCIWQNGHNLQ